MRAAPAFPAGLALAAHKQPGTAARRSSSAAPPAIAIIALDQGRMARGPGVGDRRATRVGSGTPIAIEPETRCNTAACAGRRQGALRSNRGRPRSEVGHGLCIVIDNDGSGSIAIRPLHRSTAPNAWSRRHCSHGCANSGIVGLGGAAFPTATKLAAARARGRRHARAERRRVRALDLLRRRADARACAADRARRAPAAARDRGCALHHRRRGRQARSDRSVGRQRWPRPADERIDASRRLRAVYPAGRRTSAAHDGHRHRSARPDGLPSDAGVLCQNVGTAAAVARLRRAPASPACRAS